MVIYTEIQNCFLNLLNLVVFFSLLDILSGKKETIDGVVLVDGKQQQQNFKFKSGYVVQVCEP